MKKKKTKLAPKLATKRRVGLADICLLVLFWCIVIIFMEKVKWEAARLIADVSTFIVLLAAVGIIVGEYFKYMAVRHIRKLFGKAKEG